MNAHKRTMRTALIAFLITVGLITAGLAAAPAFASTAQRPDIPQFIPDDAAEVEPFLPIYLASQHYTADVNERITITITDRTGASRRSTIRLIIGPSQKQDTPGPVALRLADLHVVENPADGTVRAINARDGLYYAQWPTPGNPTQPATITDILPPIPLPQLTFRQAQLSTLKHAGSWPLSPNINWTTAQTDRRRNQFTLEGEGDAGPATMTIAFTGRLIDFDSPTIDGGRVRLTITPTGEQPTVTTLDTAGRQRVPTLARLTPREGPAKQGQRCPPIIANEINIRDDSSSPVPSAWSHWSLEDDINDNAHPANTTHMLVFIRSATWTEHADSFHALARSVRTTIEQTSNNQQQQNQTNTPIKPAVIPRLIVVRDLTDPADDNTLLQGLDLTTQPAPRFLVSRSPGTTIDRFVPPQTPAAVVLVDHRGVIIDVKPINSGDMQSLTDSITQTIRAAPNNNTNSDPK